MVADLTYVWNPASPDVRIHKVTCYTLKGRVNGIGVQVSGRVRRKLCNRCHPDPDAAQRLHIHQNADPDYRRIARAWLPPHEFGGQYPVVVEPYRMAALVERGATWGFLRGRRATNVDAAYTAEDEALDNLDEEAYGNRPIPWSCQNCNQPQTEASWAAGICRQCGVFMTPPRPRRIFEPLSMEELSRA